MKSSIMNFQKKLLMRTVARVVVLRKVMNTDTSKRMEEQGHEHDPDPSPTSQLLVL